MIKAIIFDFGEVFINLDSKAPIHAFKKLGLQSWNSVLEANNLAFETGKIDESTFLKGFQKFIPEVSLDDIREAWNSILMDFPLERLEFLENLTKNYRLFLLSNTDAIHIQKFEQMVGDSFAKDFYQCFEKIYFSYETKLRKPDLESYKLILRENELIPKQTLFIDDKGINIEAAAKLGIQTWHLQVGKEEVTDLFSKKIIQL